MVVTASVGFHQMYSRRDCSEAAGRHPTVMRLPMLYSERATRAPPNARVNRGMPAMGKHRAWCDSALPQRATRRHSHQRPRLASFVTDACGSQAAPRLPRRGPGATFRARHVGSPAASASRQQVGASRAYLILC